MPENDISIDASEVNIPTVAAGDALFNNIVGTVYIVIAAVALFYIVRAALKFLTSGSDPNAVKSAKNGILYAIIALVASTVVFAVIGFITRTVG